VTGPDRSRDAHTGGSDRVGELVRLAGRRPVPDPAQMSRARAAAHHEWVRVVERRTWRLPFWPLGAAAIAAGVIGAAVWFPLRRPSAPVPGAEIATLQTVTGSVRVASAGEPPRTVSAAGLRIRAGDRIETMADGRAAVIMPGAVSVRFDRASTAVFESAGRLVLANGAVYVDAGPHAAPALRVETPFGVVRHIGTQFEVRLDRSALTVRVREGSVAVETSGSQLHSKAGEAIVVTSGRPPERQAIATSGPEWLWVSAMARPFRLEGASAPAFLDWVSREEGWRWEYASPSLRDRIARIVLHGSIDGLTPEEALAAVLPTCGLTSRLDGDRLIVGAVR